ncbi:37S ribosomal protein S24, mitochondrial [Dimargaris verticillata]|uniref:37S ribosomal protein S24, mitochondrial n=1 Tax=Dimargaris verticillata TaxID=2761393 RepID=A0A9W8B8E9_9FUNG|nr:37S ribosomal protein S24, mitochondrial [Dimargaris verticillata]
MGKGSSRASLLVARCFSATHTPVLSGRQRYINAVKELDDELLNEPLPSASVGDLTRPGQMLWMSVLEVKEYLKKLKTEVPHLAQKTKAFTGVTPGVEQYVNRPVTHKPSSPPAPANPVLRFRLTRYALEEEHTRANTVVMTVAIPQLQLSPDEHHKLRLLAGAHKYKFETDELVIGCNDYSTQAQNKAHLVRVFCRLLKEVKNHDDLFKDVPAPKPGARRRRKYNMRRLRFPDAWARPQMPAAAATPPAPTTS